MLFYDWNWGFFCFALWFDLAYGSALSSLVISFRFADDVGLYRDYQPAFFLLMVYYLCPGNFMCCFLQAVFVNLYIFFSPSLAYPVSTFS